MNYPKSYSTAVRYGRTQTTDTFLKLLHENADARQPGSTERLVAADAFDEAEEPHMAATLRSPHELYFSEWGGNAKLYQRVNGTTYPASADPTLVAVLETARANGTRLHISRGHTERGHPEEGRDWLEEFETYGTVGRSTGTMKIPLLIHNRRSMGGGSLSPDSIVRVRQTPGGRVLWQHPKYHHGRITLKANPLPDNPEYTHGVYQDDQNQANFRSEAAARHYIRKLGLTLSE